MKVLQHQTIKIISISIELDHSCECNGNKSMGISMLNFFVFVWGFIRIFHVLFEAFYSILFRKQKNSKLLSLKDK